MNIKRAEFTYFDAGEISGNKIVFSTEESRHITKVCRLGTGDRLTATDGNGRLNEVELTIASRDNVEGTILSSRVVERPDRKCDLAVPLSSMAKSDWIIEKCVETGVAQFHLYTPEKTTKKTISDKRRERLERVATSAMKQSMRAFRPDIIFHDSLQNLILLFDNYELVLIGYPHSDSTSVSKVVKTGSALSVLVVVGPEAGFTDQELNSAINAGAVPVNFGSYRLRMETAAVILPALVIEAFDK